MKCILIRANLLAITLLMSILYCNGEGNNKYTLEFKLAKGETYKQHCLVEADMNQEMMGQKMRILTKVDMKTHYDVIDNQNGLYDLQLSYDGMKMDTSVGDMKMSFDSNTKDSVASMENMGPIFKAIVGIPLRVQVTQQGKVQAVSGIEKIQEAVIKAVGGNLNSQVKQQLIGMANQQFSEESLRTMFSQFSSYFPNKPVGIGDSWDINTPINSNGIILSSKITLTLKQVVGNIATLDGVGTIGTPEGGSTQKMQGMDVKINMKGEQAGTVQIDINTGWTVGMVMTGKITGEMNIMNTAVPLDLVTKTTITAE